WWMVGIQSISVVDGEVVVEAENISGDIRIVVRPDFDADDVGFRVSDAYMEGADPGRNIDDAIKLSGIDWPPQVDTIALTPSASGAGHTYTPNPAEFGGSTGNHMVGVIIGAGT